MVDDINVLGQAEGDEKIGTFTERQDVVVVAAFEIRIDLVSSLKQLEGRHVMLLECSIEVIQTGREGTIEVIIDDCEESTQHCLK